MKRNSIRELFALGLVAAMIVTGCNHAPVQQPVQTSSRFSSRTPASPAWTASPDNRSPVAAYPPANPPTVLPDVAPRSSSIKAAADQPQPPKQGTIAIDPSAPIAPAVERTSLDPVRETSVRRRSFVDTTAHPCFGHADDYHWLSGQVHYSRLSKTWRLRYASVDEEDAYGGSVTLVNDLRLTNLQEGQYIRVEGHLQKNQDKGIAPPFQVDSVQVLEHKDSLANSEKDANPSRQVP
jgi:hypothetical protein